MKKEQPPLNIELKAAIKEISSRDPTRKGNFYEINGENYRRFSYEHEYSPLQYDLEAAQGNVVWKNIFEKHRNASYYSFEQEGVSKMIKVQAHIYVSVY